MTKEALINRLTGAIALLYPDDMNPMAYRVLTKILEEGQENDNQRSALA